VVPRDLLVVQHGVNHKLQAVERNAVGDLVLDVAAMRALASPARLTLFDRLRRGGDAGPADAADLEALRLAGLVTNEDGRWAVVGKGIFFEIPEDPEGQAAARDLVRVMLLHSIDVPRDWVTGVEPQLDVEWARAAGLFNARVRMTADELRDLQERLEDLLAPLTTRAPEDVPAGAAEVRILSYFLPETG
jgi:hypothetical protein